MSINYSKPSPEPKPASSGPSGGGVNLSKVTLTKSSPTISLTKSGGGSGVLRVNLNWKTTAPSSGRPPQCQRMPLASALVPPWG